MITQNEIYFLMKARYWLDKFEFRDWGVIKDNKMWALMGVFKETKILKYNSKFLNIPRNGIIYSLFHEIGHIYKNNYYDSYPYDDFLNKVISEHIAERRSFYWLKKYYPKYYKEEMKACKYRIENTINYPKSRSYYFQAYSQLPEYNKYL